MSQFVFDYDHYLCSPRFAALHRNYMMLASRYDNKITEVNFVGVLAKPCLHFAGCSMFVGSCSSLQGNMPSVRCYKNVKNERVL